jgi:hypothetical protein
MTTFFFPIELALSLTYVNLLEKMVSSVGIVEKGEIPKRTRILQTYKCF